MESPTKPCVQIIFHTKEGYEYSRRIEFDTEEEFNRWNFDRYFSGMIQCNFGMFMTDQDAVISISTIARIEYEAYDGVPF